MCWCSLRVLAKSKCFCHNWKPAPFLCYAVFRPSVQHAIVMSFRVRLLLIHLLQLHLSLDVVSSTSLEIMRVFTGQQFL